MFTKISQVAKNRLIQERNLIAVVEVEVIIRRSLQRDLQILMVSYVC